MPEARACISSPNVSNVYGVEPELPTCPDAGKSSLEESRFVRVQ